MQVFAYFAYSLYLCIKIFILQYKDSKKCFNGKHY